MARTGRVPVKPKMVRWARERASLEIADLIKAFPKIEEWENENSKISPTVKQLRDFAKKTHVPYGYLFLREPPEESLPIHDFRTLGREQRRHPSPNLLDTIYSMQRRQGWLHEERIHDGIDPIPFVGSASLRDDPKEVAQNMRETLGLANEWAKKIRIWEDAVKELHDAIEQTGITVVINGVVGNSTNRKLDRNEFLGFVLHDKYAPLIFINGADYKSRKMFTLAHELAHIWLGEEGEGLSLHKIKHAVGSMAPHTNVENFCDKVAANFLVPDQVLRNHWEQGVDTDKQCQTLAHFFKASPIVIGRRAFDEGLINRDAFFDFYNEYTARERDEDGPSGGNFYNSQSSRVGADFIKQLYYSAMEGRIGFRDAYRMADLKGKTFHEWLRRLGVER